MHYFSSILLSSIQSGSRCQTPNHTLAVPITPLMVSIIQSCRYQNPCVGACVSRTGECVSASYSSCVADPRNTFFPAQTCNSLPPVPTPPPSPTSTPTPTPLSPTLPSTESPVPPSNSPSVAPSLDPTPSPILELQCVEGERNWNNTLVCRSGQFFLEGPRPSPSMIHFLKFSENAYQRDFISYHTVVTGYSSMSYFLFFNHLSPLSPFYLEILSLTPTALHSHSLN